MDKICSAREVAQEDGSVGYVPEIPFSDFPPGGWSAGPDADGKLAYFYYGGVSLTGDKGGVPSPTQDERDG